MADIPQDVYLLAAQSAVMFPHPMNSEAATGKVIDIIARAIVAERSRSLPLREALDQIEGIASGSSTANSLPHIAKLARAVLDHTTCV